MIRSKARLRWFLLSALSGACVFQSVNCSSLARESVVQGTLAWVTGAVGSSFGGSAALLNDVLLGLLTNPPRD